jgi:hypothetical protein
MIARPPKTSYQGFVRFINAEDLDAHMKEFIMASKNQFTYLRNKIIAGILLCAAFCAFVLPAQVYAKGTPSTLPSLSTFIATVKDGAATTLRGIYIPNIMAFPIQQQPYGNPGFVSPVDSVITQFSIATEVGNVGLLAHNMLAGKSFSEIKQGDQIILIYGDGHTEVFLVENTQRYQALDPLNPYSQFKNLETQKSLTAEDLFRTVYRGEYHLTLQTCIENEGNLSWGRLFVIAKPIANKSFNMMKTRIN